MAYPFDLRIENKFPWAHTALRGLTHSCLSSFISHQPPAHDPLLQSSCSSFCLFRIPCFLMPQQLCVQNALPSPLHFTDPVPLLLLPLCPLQVKCPQVNL